MFECHACSRRLLRALTPRSEPLPRLTLLTSKLFHTSSRKLQESGYKARPRERPSSTRPARDFDRPRQTQGSDRWRGSLQADGRRRPPYAADRPPQERKQHIPGVGQLTTPRGKARDEDTIRQERFLRTELQYITHPAALADHVEDLLKKDDYEKALAMTRLSSRGASNTVSWNYLIDWNTKNARRKGAIEIYNEMKKRGQKPNSQTFTILLRGLADHAGNPTTLGTALSIYHSISAPNSNVNRNIIHTNALLKICSRQLDLDSMWDIVSKLPDNGSYAASNWTFTTILQTMREKALKDSNGTGDSNAAAARREETIVEGRKLWAVIIGRWRKGDIVVDEKLVCAMGRLLTIGSRPRDWDDVLSLVQQTMAIPRAVPRLGTEAREQGGQPRVRAPNSGADVKNDNSEIVVEHDEARPGSEFGDSFGYEASTQARGRTSAPSNYAKPGNNTLSLLMDACLKTAQKGPALHYWRLLTQPGGVHVVRPDTDNIHMLLRILRFKRASSEAMKILQHDMRELRLPYTAKTLRLAMSACVRDVLSPNVMENANRLLDLMSENFDKPDLNVLAQYTEVAAKSAEHLATVHASHANIGKTNANEPRADIKLLVSAVNRLKGGEWRPSLLSDTIKSVRDELGLAIPRPGTGPSPDPRSLEFAESDELGDAPAATAKPREKVAAFVAQRELLSTLLRNVVGLYDKILNAVAEERAKLSKTSSDAPYAIFGITPAAEKGFVDAKKSMAKQLTRLNNRGQEVKRQEVQRGARQGRMDRRVVEENQEEGEEGEEGESEEEIDMGGRKWMPGVRPRSGIQKSMARQKAVVEPTIEEDVGEEEAVEELDMGDRKWLPSSSIDRSVAGQRSGHRANAGSRR